MAKVLVLEAINPEAAYNDFECDMEQFKDAPRKQNGVWEFISFSGVLVATGVTFDPDQSVHVVGKGQRIRPSFTFDEDGIYVYVQHSWNAAGHIHFGQAENLNLIAHADGEWMVRVGQALYRITNPEQGWKLRLSLPSKGATPPTEIVYQGDTQSFQKISEPFYV